MKKVLLVIDMQEGFRYPETVKIIPKINKLITKFNGEIVFLQFINKKESLFEKQLNWQKFQNKNDQEIFKELKNEKFKKYKHSTYSVLTKEILKLIKNKEIYICGIYTDVTIIKTAMDLFDLNKKCIIIEDACAGQFKKSLHQSAIKSLTHIIGKPQIKKVNEVV